MPWRNAQERRSPFEFCPDFTHHPGFRKWLIEVARYLPGAMYDAGGMRKVIEHYEALPKNDRCPTASQLAAQTWSKGRHGPIVNAGEGTTGTRFLSCVFDSMGFRTSHNEVLSPENAYESLNDYDYVSDNPLNMRAIEIFAGRHGGQIPGVLLSLRDPKEWARSRIKHHRDGGAEHWRAASACLGWGGAPISETDQMPLAVLTYNAFSACAATSPAFRYDDDHVLLVNLFQGNRSEEEVDAELARNLSRWLLNENRSRFLIAPTRNNTRISHAGMSVESVTKGVEGCAYSMSHTGATHAKYLSG
jgi:hypothetical protein